MFPGDEPPGPPSIPIGGGFVVPYRGTATVPWYGNGPRHGNGTAARQLARDPRKACRPGAQALRPSDHISRFRWLCMLARGNLRPFILICPISGTPAHTKPNPEPGVKERIEPEACHKGPNHHVNLAGHAAPAR